MRAFKYFYLTVNFITGNQLQWALNDGFKDQGPYNFLVQVSATIDFHEILYTIKVDDNYFAIDDSNIKQNWSKDFYYRIKLTTGDINFGSVNIYYSEVLLYDSAPATKRKYRMAADIQRKFNVWAKYAGTQGQVLKRKVYGPIDTVNVDKITGIPLNNNLGSFGTGIVGGYYNPIPVAMVIESNAKDKSLDPGGQGVKELIDLVVRTNGFPIIENYDVVVRADANQRYYVVGFSNISFPGTQIVIGQKLEMKLLPINDKIYKISVPPYQVPQIPLQDQPGV